MELSFSSLENYINTGDIEEIKLNYYDLLVQLTNTNIPTNELFVQYVHNIHKTGIIYVCYVNINGKNKIIGTCSGVIEHKLIHGCSKICHVEDVVVDKNYRNKNICFNLVNFMIGYANEKKCYKIILNCCIELEKFYEKLKFKNEGYYMVYRF